MENKNNGGLIAVIILLVVALLGTGLYIAYDKGLIFNNESEVEEKKEESINGKDSVKEENLNSQISYYTDGSYYYLILYPEVKLSQVTNAHGTNDQLINTFYLMINEGYSSESLRGAYEINDGKLTLRILGNYSATYLNNVVNILTVNGSNNVKVETLSEGSSYYITLNYSDKNIMFGNTELIKK